MKESNHNNAGGISFSKISGTSYINGQTSADWLITGVTGTLDLRHMSTGDQRRDFPPGDSGRHLGSSLNVCAAELRVNPLDPPPGSYHCRFMGYLRQVDARAAGDSVFSGSYYGADKTFSYRLMAASEDLFDTGNLDVIMRHSVPMLQSGNSGDVLALFPSAIENLDIAWIQPLGDSPHIPVILRDGQTKSTTDFPPP
jgi:hypothetical protein